MSSTEISTRERILNETWRLMEQRGGQGVRIEEIAQASHVSRQAVYLHFGSRSELLIQTTRYVDEIFNIDEKFRAACTIPDTVLSLSAFIEVWGNYVPEIYGLASALLALRDTDEAAEAAWQDRMVVLYQGCRIIIDCLDKAGKLAPEWTVETATDFCWALISVRTWESLTIERGWTQEQYIERMQTALKRALLKPS